MIDKEKNITTVYEEDKKFISDIINFPFWELCVWLNSVNKYIKKGSF